MGLDQYNIPSIKMRTVVSDLTIIIFLYQPANLLVTVGQTLVIVVHTTT